LESLDERTEAEAGDSWSKKKVVVQAVGFQDEEDVVVWQG
jgi:hypothetical protein